MVQSWFRIKSDTQAAIVSPTKHLVIVCGPTGIGKTRVAIDLANHFGSEIISADSRQMYKEMRIGTAVPVAEELSRIPHHFVQFRSVKDYYNASMFELDVLDFLKSYYDKKSIAIMVGGSGLYIDAVCKGIDDLPTIDREVRRKWKKRYETMGLEFLQAQVEKYDPDYYAVVDRQNHKRLLKALEVFDQTGKPYSAYLQNTPKDRNFKSIKLGLNTDRKALYERINARVDRMIEDGLIEEARRLYPSRHLTPLKTVGYRELFAHFDGKVTLEEAIGQIKNHSRAYARRQITWFRRDKEICWFEPRQLPEMYEHIKINLK